MAISVLQKTYNRLRAVKKDYCAGKTTKQAVKNAGDTYVTAAVASGQKKRMPSEKRTGF